MGSAAVAQGKSSLQISFEVLNFLYVGDQSAVDGLLDVLQLSLPLAVFLVSSLNFLGSVLRCVLELVLGVPSGAFEERVVNVDVDSSERNLGGS